VAPPGNQAATEKTNVNLQHRKNPVYSTITNQKMHRMKPVIFMLGEEIDNGWYKCWDRKQNK